MSELDYGDDPTCQYGNYIIGQMIFVLKYPSNELGYGPIQAFEYPPAEDGNVYLNFRCKISRSHERALVSSIIDNPTDEHRNRISLLLNRQSI